MEDLIINGQAHGNVASMLIQNGFDVNFMRPYLDVVDGKTREFITTNQAGKLVARPVVNSQATLRKDQWKLIDQAVIAAAKPRLRAVADLRQAGLVFNLPNGMSKTVLETETQSDISEATISMDGVRQSENDRPVYELNNLPLPIIHKDFYYTARQIATAANSGSPLDTTTAELAARRVAEAAEKLLIGTYGTYKFGGGEIFGYKNFPHRLTKAMTLPTASGWIPEVAVQEVLNMRLQAQQAHHYGPYRLYCSLPWDEFLDKDYSDKKGSNTLRERLLQIRGIDAVETLDYLNSTGYEMILVQMTSDVVREVIGMDIVTVQWATEGGMKVNFKVMAIMVPQLRADQNLRTGIVHGVSA